MSVTAAATLARVREVVRAARARGYGDLFTPKTVRESAAFFLREALESLGMFDKSEIQWHIANPGKRQTVLHA